MPIKLILIGSLINHPVGFIGSVFWLIPMSKVHMDNSVNVLYYLGYILLLLHITVLLLLLYHEF